MSQRPSIAPLVVAFVLALNLGAPARASDDATVVATQTGLVRGRAHADVLEWKGIPYAAPPTGARRFAVPEPAARWTGEIGRAHV